MTANVIYTSQTDVIEHQVRLARQQADLWWWECTGA